MKGIIVKAAEKLVISKFGIDKWEEILVASGLDSDEFFMLRDDLDDTLVMTIISKIAEVLNLSLDEVLAAYAKYWVHEFLPEVYPQYQFSSAKEFINSIEDVIHSNVRASMPNAHPPLFEFDWKNENELELRYFSPRGLIALARLMLIEIGNKYNTVIEVEVKNETTLLLVWK